MKQVILLLLISIFYNANAQSPDQQIRSILNKQTEAWNKGDLVNFMKGYWQSDSLLFVGKSGPSYGYDAALKNYQKGYPDTASMGKLAFTLIQVKPLTTDTWFVLGKWALTRSIGNVSGHYTLIFKKIKGEWVIVVDHSS
ncbi:MAG: nuclear transport factor 2 family protein [Sphingobacteriia bacterium]|jgi:ketosteroid isomerase-like protein